MRVLKSLCAIALLALTSTCAGAAGAGVLRRPGQQDAAHGGEHLHQPDFEGAAQDRHAATAAGLAAGRPVQEFHGPRGDQPRHVTSLGSGFIIDPSGYIVTNNHVIEDSDIITVILHDGISLPAKVVGRDPQDRPGAAQGDRQKPLPATRFGDSDKARIGDWVMAIGDPFGIGSPCTAGIVSARNRNINAGPYDDFIQTDAPINRGNSGGPLFDMDGNVIGINSAIFSPSGGSVGIGFAIPSNLRAAGDRPVAPVRHRAARLDRRAHPDCDGRDRRRPGPGQHERCAGGGRHRWGPAAKAGLRNGDLITGFDGKPVGDERALPRIVADTPVNKTVNVDLLRRGQKQTVRVTVLRLADDAKPDRPVKAPPAPVKTQSKVAQLGLTLGALDTAARAKFKVGGGVEGVMVTAVESGSTAAEKNLRVGDVIVEISSQPVKSPDEVARRLDADAKAGKKVALLLISRGGDLTFVGLRLN